VSICNRRRDDAALVFEGVAQPIHRIASADRAMKEQHRAFALTTCNVFPFETADDDSFLLHALILRITAHDFDTQNRKGRFILIRKTVKEGLYRTAA
jgi:hypothetical protein